MGQLSGSKLPQVVLFLFAVSIGYAQTVVLELKNGDRLSGRVVSETTNSIVLSNAWSRELVVPVEAVAKRGLPLSETNAIAAAPTNTVGSNLVLVVTDRVTTNVVTNAVALAKAVAATNTLFTSPWLKNWHGDLQAGMDLTFSERNRQVFYGRAKVTYAKDRLKALIDYDTTYGVSQVDVDKVVNGTVREERESVTDANRMHGTIKVDYDLKGPWYAYGMAAAGYDKIRRIDYRYEVGPGIGYRLFTATNFSLSLESGFNYQKQRQASEDDGSETISTVFGRLAEFATWRITPRLTWDEKLEYTPSIKDPSLYRIRFESNLRYAMLQNVFFNLSVVDIFDSDPAENVSENDLQFRSSVGVKF